MQTERVKALFSLGTSCVPEMPVVMADGVFPSWSKPFARKSSESFDLWASDAKVQKALTAFGPQYRQKDTDSSTSNGRSQYPVEEATGLDCTQKMIGTKHISLPKALNMSAVTGGESFHKAVWMFGYHPTMAWDSLAPDVAVIQHRLFFGGFSCLAIKH